MSNVIYIDFKTKSKAKKMNKQQLQILQHVKESYFKQYNKPLPIKHQHHLMDLLIKYQNRPIHDQLFVCYVYIRSLDDNNKE